MGCQRIKGQSRQDHEGSYKENNFIGPILFHFVNPCLPHSSLIRQALHPSLCLLSKLFILETICQLFAVVIPTPVLLLQADFLELNVLVHGTLGQITELNLGLRCKSTVHIVRICKANQHVILVSLEHIQIAFLSKQK